MTFTFDFGPLIFDLYLNYSDSLIKATELGAKFGKVEDTKTSKGPKQKVSKYEEDLAKSKKFAQKETTDFTENDEKIKDYF